MTSRARIKDALAEQWKRREVPTVTLHLPYPPSTNRLYRRTTTGVWKTPRYATWARDAGNELVAQRPGKVSGYYTLTLALGRPDRRRRDLDNTVKAISDILVTHGVVEDDSMARRVTLDWLDTDEIGATVTVTSVAAMLARTVIPSVSRSLHEEAA